MTTFIRKLTTREIEELVHLVATALDGASHGQRLEAFGSLIDEATMAGRYAPAEVEAADRLMLTAWRLADEDQAVD